MNPLSTDPDFYRKVVGMMQQSKEGLKIDITGSLMTFYLRGKRVGEMNTAEFYKMSVNEVWKTLGVSNDYKKDWLV